LKWENDEAWIVSGKAGIYWAIIFLNY